MGDARVVTTAARWRIFTTADPDQVSAAKLNWRAVKTRGVTLPKG